LSTNLREPGGCLIQEGADNIDINTEIIDGKDSLSSTPITYRLMYATGVWPNLKLFQKLWENVLEFLIPLALRTLGMTFVKKHH
jgi:hypothetical protein